MRHDYKGVQVIEADLLSDGAYSHGTIFVNRKLSPEAKRLTIRHEYEHHLFYREHPHITNKWVVVGSALASIYLNGPFSYVLLMPFVLNVWHEAVVHYDTHDFGRRAWAKLILSLCIIVAILGLSRQFGGLFM